MLTGVVDFIIVPLLKMPSKMLDLILIICFNVPQLLRFFGGVALNFDIEQVEKHSERDFCS
jgi:hypothetical protein